MRVLEHEFLERRCAAVQKFFARNLVLFVWHYRFLVDSLPHRLHYEKSEEERQADYDLVGRRLLRSERVPQKRKYDCETGKAGHQNENCRRKRQDCQKENDL